MATVRVVADPHKLPNKKDGFPRSRPIEVEYSVVIDGELWLHFRRAYGLIEGKLLLEGAVKAMCQDLKERYSNMVLANRAIEEFNRNMEAMKVDQTVEV